LVFFIDVSTGSLQRDSEDEHDEDDEHDE